MGMYAPLDIFKSKFYEIIIDIEGIKAYIDDILILSKESVPKHIYQIRVIFSRLCIVGLRVNAPEWSFGLKETPYIGYVVTQYEIKPDPKKVQGIMDLGRTTTSTEAQSLIGMVQ